MTDLHDSVYDVPIIALWFVELTEHSQRYPRGRNVYEQLQPG